MNKKLYEKINIANRLNLVEFIYKDNKKYYLATWGKNQWTSREILRITE